MTSCKGSDLQVRVGNDIMEEFSDFINYVSALTNMQLANNDNGLLLGF